MVAKHRKNHRQSEVGVVHAALFSTFAVRSKLFGIHGNARSHGSHYFALPRNDPEKHIGTHRSGNHRPHQQKGGTACKQMTS